VDQQQMGKWNYYADVFRVLATPTGSFGWGNNRFDMCGFPSSATMQSQFGAPWDSNTLGVCYWRTANNVLVEADVSLNPAWSWTLNDEWVFNGANAWSFRNVMLHELGHAWGLDHNFTDYSVMNYVTQSVGPLLTLPMMDDAEAIRRRYPSAAQSVSDVAVYLVNKGVPAADGKYQSWQEAAFPVSAKAGANIDISGYRLENVGTVAKNVVVEWYLTSSRGFGSSYRHLRTVDYGALNRFAYFFPGTTTVSIPLDMPAGPYHIGAFIRDDGGASQSEFPMSNNRAFTGRFITVQQRLSHLSVDKPTLKPGQSATVTAHLYGSSNGGSIFPAVSPTAPLSHPPYAAIPVGSASTAFVVTAKATEMPATVRLTANFGGDIGSVDIQVVPDLTLGHARTALQAIAGFRGLSIVDADFLNVERSGDSASAVDMRDVVRLVRQIGGLDAAG
jgi:hypothetical protein